jgi:hypothetical protein
MKPQELLRKFTSGGARPRTRFDVSIKKLDADEQVVYGEVYAPNLIDSHGDMMLAEDVRLMAHRFMMSGLNDQIDIMHDNKVIKAAAIESWIAGDDDAVYNPGAWVVGVKIADSKVWQKIKRGDYAGYSIEAMVNKQEAIVEVQHFKHMFLYSEEHDGHDHAVFVTLDENGRVTGGRTSKAADGHWHKIRYGTKTATTNGHSHRYVLP